MNRLPKSSVLVQSLGNKPGILCMFHRVVRYSLDDHRSVAKYLSRIGEFKVFKKGISSGKVTYGTRPLVFLNENLYSKHWLGKSVPCWWNRVTNTTTLHVYSGLWVFQSGSVSILLNSSTKILQFYSRCLNHSNRDSPFFQVFSFFSTCLKL